MKQGFDAYKTAPCRRLLPLALLWVCVSSTALAAAEIYTWTDENGVKHYSDQPSSPTSQAQAVEAEEAYRPGSVEVKPPTVETADGAEEALTPAQARRAKLRGEREEMAASREEVDRLCGLHRERLEKLEPARRAFYVDDTGETVRLDDDMRIGLIQESRDFLDENCKG